MEGILEEKKKLVIIYALIIFSVVINIFIVPSFLSTTAIFLNIAIWFIIFLLARKVSNQHNRFKGQKDKLTTTFIIVSIYLIVYYLSGIFFGYTKTIYAKTFFGIIKNLFMYVFVILLQEYTRSRLINNTRSKLTYAFITSVFVILSFDYTTFFNNFASGDSTFKFVASSIYPEIIKSVLCSFLVKYGSYELSLTFLLIPKILQYVVPIIPDLDWFIIVAFDSALVILEYYYIYYEHIINIERCTRKEIKYGNPRTTIPSILFVILFTFFVAGIFPVMPVAVMSTSMKPYFNRGDVVLVKKIKQEQLKNICVGDVIEYTIDGKSVVHRVVKINEKTNGELEFITKGDANDSEDTYPVSESQVVGITKYYIPYIGYPSVIFSEKVLKMEAEFEYKGE